MTATTDEATGPTRRRHLRRRRSARSRRAPARPGRPRGLPAHLPWRDAQERHHGPRRGRRVRDHPRARPGRDPAPHPLRRRPLVAPRARAPQADLVDRAPDRLGDPDRAAAGLHRTAPSTTSCPPSCCPRRRATTRASSTTRRASRRCRSSARRASPGRSPSTGSAPRRHTKNTTIEDYIAVVDRAVDTADRGHRPHLGQPRRRLPGRLALRDLRGAAPRAGQHPDPRRRARSTSTRATPRSAPRRGSRAAASARCPTRRWSRWAGATCPASSCSTASSR